MHKLIIYLYYCQRFAALIFQNETYIIVFCTYVYNMLCEVYTRKDNDAFFLEMADAKVFKVGTKVEVSGKGLIGTVAFIGTTHFSSGKLELYNCMICLFIF